MRGPHGLFLVTSRRRYRGHEPGTRFETQFDAAIDRALQRGDIQLLEEITPALQPGSYRLPADWPLGNVADTQQPQGRRKAPFS